MSSLLTSLLTEADKRFEKFAGVDFEEYEAGDYGALTGLKGFIYAEIERAVEETKREQKRQIEEVCMTPPPVKQKKGEDWEKELLELKSVNYNVYFGVGGGDNALPFEEAIAELKAFISGLVKQEQGKIFKLKADLAHAIGYCRGLGYPETYLEKQYPELLTPTKEEV